MKINIKEIISIFIKGILMGSADIVPGISGGTIALITNIYERLVKGISNINFSFVKPFLKKDFKEFKLKLFDEVDFELFIPLILGICLAFIFLSGVIDYLLKVFPTYTYSFFLGLIIASVYVLYSKLEEINIKLIIITIIATALAYLFVGLNPIANNHSLIVIFFSGMIAVCAMILPGISGSLILILLGQYNYMLSALHNMNIVEIIVFVIGAVIGILGFSKFLNYLLENYETVTMAFLIGIMIGTLRKPFTIISLNITNSWTNCLIFIIIGAFLIILLEKLAT